MIRNLLATTALATLVATAAYAQQDPATAARRRLPRPRSQQPGSAVS